MTNMSIDEFTELQAISIIQTRKAWEQVERLAKIDEHSGERVPDLTNVCIARVLMSLRSNVSILLEISAKDLA